MYFNQPYHYYLGLCCNLASFTFCRTSRQIDAKHLTLEIGIGIGSADMVKRDRTGARSEGIERRRTTGRRGRLGSLARSVSHKKFLWIASVAAGAHKHGDMYFPHFLLPSACGYAQKRTSPPAVAGWRWSTGSVVRWFGGIVCPLLCIAYGLARRVDIFIPNSWAIFINWPKKKEREVLERSRRGAGGGWCGGHGAWCMPNGFISGWPCKTCSWFAAY